MAFALLAWWSVVGLTCLVAWALALSIPVPPALHPHILLLPAYAAVGLGAYLLSLLVSGVFSMEDHPEALASEELAARRADARPARRSRRVQRQEAPGGSPSIAFTFFCLQAILKQDIVAVERGFFA